MIYLRHPDSTHTPRRAICETERAAQLLEAQGFQRCSKAYHRLLWQIDDDRALAALFPASAERAVGERPWWW